MWGRHYLPHDADHAMLGEDITTKATILRELGMTNIEIVPRISSMRAGYEVTRDEMVRDVWIDKDGCAEGIKCLDAYQFVWSEARGVFTDEPLHNWASHGADAFRQWAQSADKVRGSSTGPSIHKLKARDRRRQL